MGEGGREGDQEWEREKKDKKYMVITMSAKRV